MSRPRQTELTVVELPAPQFNKYEQFRREYSLTYREFAKLLVTGKSNVHRACLGEVTNPDFLSRRSEVEPRLRAFLAKRMLSADGVRAACNDFFDTPDQEETVPIPRCELTKAATRHFKLKADPFALDLEPDEYFISPQLQKVIEQTSRAVLQRRFLAVLGGVGSGKTALRHRLMTSFASDERVRFIWIEMADFEQMTFAELIWLILTELGEKPAQMKVARVRQLGVLLESLSKSGVRVSLCIEEAHRLSDRSLSTLKQLWEKGEATNDHYNRFLGVLLFGQTRLEERLRSLQFQEVIERLQLIKMPEFKATQKGISQVQRDFLAHRLAAVGGKLDELFEEESLNEFARRATTPLALGNLANAALMAAYELGEAKVQAGMLNAENEPVVRGMRQRA